METRQIHISDYNYPLPDSRIAKFPLAERDHSKLLVYRHGEISEDRFFNIASYLPKGALMIFNNTRVIQARLHFRKDTGALIEVFLLEPSSPADYEQMFQTRRQCEWHCLVGNLKKWKNGTLRRSFEVSGKTVTLSAEYLSPERTCHLIRLSWDNEDVSFAEILDAAGELPIPPYLNRDTQESDKTTYQTVYSKIKGSVAAPTAGLHFTSAVLSDIDAHGIERDEVTLHVGAGTFKPVKSDVIEGHEMHTEFIAVHRDTIRRLIAHNAMAIAVGTTSVRTLESLYFMGLKTIANPDVSPVELHVSQWEPYSPHPTTSPVEALKALDLWMERHGFATLHSSPQTIIAPGYEYKIVKMLVTNFHQPQSTLLLLVSAFVNGDWRQIYDYALAHDFRFLSYGDSNLIIP